MSRSRATSLALTALVSTILLVGCPQMMPPSVTTTNHLATSPKLDYDGVVVRVMIDSTGVTPNPKLCRMLMAEIVKRLVQWQTFDFVAVEDTSILEAATVQEIPRKDIISVDSLNSLSHESVDLEVTMLEYDKGDSVTRYLLDILSGGGAVGIKATLIDRRYGHVVVAAKFRDTIRGQTEAEYHVIKPLARSVTEYINKQMRKLAKSAAK